MFETLESRQLLSASVTFADGTKAVHGGGGLTVTSGNANTNVAIVENLNSVSGDHNVDVFNNNTLEHAFFSGVTGKIQVSGGSGIDRIVVDTTTLNINVSGGEGADVITVRNMAATGDSQVEGGGGNDTIILVASHTSQINGGGGDDVFALNTGSIDGAVLFDYEGSNAVVNGGGGNDIFYVYDGNAKINGAGGDDVIVDLSAGLANYDYKGVETVAVV